MALRTEPLCAVAAHLIRQHAAMRENDSVLSNALPYGAESYAMAHGLVKTLGYQD